MKEKYKGYKISIKPDDDAENPRAWDNLGTMVCWHTRYSLGDQNGKRDYGDPETFLRELARDVGAEFDGGADCLEKDYVILPLFLYDHSGITMNTTGFSCGWDSGKVGWIYATKEKFRKETGYTEDELFHPDPKRLPKVGERVKVKNRQEWAKVLELKEDTVTVDSFWQYSKPYLAAHMAQLNTEPETVPLSDITEVMANHAEEMLKGEVETYDQFLTDDVWGYVIKRKGEEVDSCWGFFGQDYCLQEARAYVDAIAESETVE